MRRKHDLKVGTDWLPFMIDGCEVKVFFPSAYEDNTQSQTTTLQTMERVEKALLANYKISLTNAKYSAKIQ